MTWTIAGEGYMPDVEFAGRKVLLTFKVMPTPEGLRKVLETTEQSIAWVNAVTGSQLVVDYRLPETSATA